MPRIDLCFSGWIRGANVETAMNPTNGASVDVSNMPASELIEKLTSGELCMSLADALDNTRSSEVELFDFAVAE